VIHYYHMLLGLIIHSSVVKSNSFYHYLHYYLCQGGGYAMRSVCQSFCLCADYCRSNQPTAMKLGIMIRPTNWTNWLTFRDDHYPDMDSRSLPLASPLQNEDFRRFINISHTVTKMTDANKVRTPQHFGSDLKDKQIRIWINQKSTVCPEKSGLPM